MLYLVGKKTTNTFKFMKQGRWSNTESKSRVKTQYKKWGYFFEKKKTYNLLSKCTLLLFLSSFKKKIQLQLNPFFKIFKTNQPQTF